MLFSAFYSPSEVSQSTFCVKCVRLANAIRSERCREEDAAIRHAAGQVLVSRRVCPKRLGYTKGRVHTVRAHSILSISLSSFCSTAESSVFWLFMWSISVCSSLLQVTGMLASILVTGHTYGFHTMGGFSGQHGRLVRITSTGD